MAAKADSSPARNLAEFVAALVEAARRHHHGQGRQAGRRRDRRADAASRARRHPRRRRQFAVHRHRAARQARCEAQGIRFVGMGVSGGEEGALQGPSMMPGGDDAAYARIAPILDEDGGAGRRRRRAAPSSARTAPATTSRWCTTASNTPTCSSSPRPTTFSSPSTASTPARSPRSSPDWNKGELDSYLIEITADGAAQARRRPARRSSTRSSTRPSRRAPAAGPRNRRSISACRSPRITEAVYARALSSRRAQREAAEAQFPRAPRPPGAAGPADIDAVARRALRLQDRRLRARLRTDEPAASAQFGWNLDLGEIAVDLARRLHHPRPLPRPHHGGLRRPSRSSPTCSSPTRSSARSPPRRARGGASSPCGRRRRRDAGVLLGARLFRRPQARPRAGQPAAGPARLFRRAHLSPARPARRLPYARGAATAARSASAEPRGVGARGEFSHRAAEFLRRLVKNRAAGAGAPAAGAAGRASNH